LYPADREKADLIQGGSLLSLVESAPASGLYKKLSETFNEEGDKELINSVLYELVSKKYLSDERYARIQVFDAERQIRRPQALLEPPEGRCVS